MKLVLTSKGSIRVKALNHMDFTRVSPEEAIVFSTEKEILETIDSLDYEGRSASEDQVISWFQEDPALSS